MVAFFLPSHSFLTAAMNFGPCCGIQSTRPRCAGRSRRTARARTARGAGSSTSGHPRRACWGHSSPPLTSWCPATGGPRVSPGDTEPAAGAGRVDGTSAEDTPRRLPIFQHIAADEEEEDDEEAKEADRLIAETRKRIPEPRFVSPAAKPPATGPEPTRFDISGQ